MDVRQRNVISRRELRTPHWQARQHCQLACSVAPLFGALFAALYSTEHTGAPRNCCWTRQIAPELDWFATFFKSTGGFIERTFLVDHYLEPNTAVDFVWTPLRGALAAFCCAAMFHKSTSPVHFPVKMLLELVLRWAIQPGNSLAALATVRLWKAHRQQRRVCLTVRGDSVAMLTLLVSMRLRTRQLRIISRELAMDSAELLLVPLVPQRLPGIANTMADALSRMAQSMTCADLPSFC